MPLPVQLQALNRTPLGKLLKIASFSIGIAFAAFLLFSFNPALAPFYPPCPFHLLTGLYCPGCGSLRACHKLLHGNLRGAFGLNPLLVVILPFVAYSFISRASSALGRRPLPVPFIRPVWIWLLFWIIMAFWVLRNLPYYPFSLLAP